MQTFDERELPLIHLPRGSTRELPEQLVKAIQGFKPLPYEPGRKAAEWLDTNVRAGTLPNDTYLVVSEDSSELFGFFVLEPMDVLVSKGDMPILQLRHEIKEPSAPQRALKLVWIARSANVGKGFGQELFDEALVKALEDDAIALLVEPYDADTAKKIWIEHYQLRTPRPSQDHPGEWTYLWHAVRTIEAEWP